MNINQSIDAILRFQNGNLTDSIEDIEEKIHNLDTNAVLPPAFYIISQLSR